MKKILSIFIFLGFLNAETLIHTSIYIDGVSDFAKKNASIVVGDDGKIKQIANGYISPDGYDYYDLRDFTVLPGLMDMHVHLGGEYQSKAERPTKVARGADQNRKTISNCVREPNRKKGHLEFREGLIKVNIFNCARGQKKERRSQIALENNG